MKNKRSLFIVVAMVLLLAVVIGMGGTTFAKYITEKNVVTTSATVAKWGYSITMETANLFGKNYAVATGVVDDAAGTAVVSVDASTKKVAPGTNGFMTFNVSGTAEVMSSITIDVSNDAKTVKLLKDATSAPITGGYEPIKWTLQKKDNTATTPAYADVVADTDFATLVSELEGESVASIAANTPVDVDYKISWAWAFETGADDNAKIQNNKYDTYLGDLAAAPTAPDAAIASIEVAFEIDVTVQQIEPKPVPTP